MSDDIDARIAALESRIEELEQSSVDAKLEEWQSKIDDLKVQARLGRMDASDEVKSSLDRLNDTWSGVRDRLDQFVSDGRTATDSLAGGLRSAGKELREAFDNARGTLLRTAATTTDPALGPSRSKR